MRIWRICRSAFSKTPLDGRGGLIAAGRWHTPRRLIVYASESLALASLEVLVHCDVDLLPTDLVAIELEIPEHVQCQNIHVEDLPRSWRTQPPTRTTQRIGNDWLDAGKGLLLRVPSALIPTEMNFLINPVHPSIRDVRVVRRMKFRFDERLARRP